MQDLAVISEATVRNLVTRQLAFDAVRSAFELIAEGSATLCDVVTAACASDKFFAIKAGFDEPGRTIGFKCGTYWRSNQASGLPAHSSTILLLDPATGFPAVLVAAGYLNGFRTAAANAVAVSFLARGDARTLGVLGAGHQAEHEIRALLEVRSLKSVKIHTRSGERAAWIQRRLQDLDVEIRVTSAEEAVRGSDIVTTVTPSTSPLVADTWVEPGTHISAMGADAPGKQELDVALVLRARRFADHPLQSVRIGEFQQAAREGAAADVVPIGEVTLGRTAGRSSDSEITIFDSSGLALQDLFVARAIYREAEAAGQIKYVAFAD